MKKLTAIFTTALATMALSASVFAAEQITSADALTIAQKEVPATSTHLSTTLEDSAYNPHYDVKFYDASTHTEYEVEVLQNGAIKEFSLDNKMAVGSNKVVLSSEEIEALVKKDFPDAKIRKVELENDNGLYEYDVKFSTAKILGDIDFNPETGAVLEKELKYQF